MLTYINLSLKEIIRRRRRALYTLSGIVLSGALLSFTFLVTSSLKSSFSRVLMGVGADIVVQTHGEPCVWAPVKLPTNLNPIPVEMVEKTRKIKGVKQASGILICWAFNGEEGNLRPSVIAGVEPWERELGPLKLSQTEGSGNWLAKGRYLNDIDVYASVIDYDFAKFMNTDVGSFIDFGDKKFEIVGIIKTGRDARIAGAQAFIPLRTAQELLKKGNIVDTIFVKLESDADSRRVSGELKRLFGETSSITTNLDFPSMVTGLSVFTNLFIWGMCIFIMIVSIGFSMRSISASISERFKEICVMKAVGWTNRSVRILFFVESLIIGLLGSMLGTGLGVMLAWGYVNSITLQLSEVLAAYPPCSIASSKFEIALSGIRIDIIALICIIAGLTLVSAIASIIVLRKLKKIECAEGIRRI